jgi:hypothetical protein
MRKLLAVALAFAAGCISKGTDIPPAKAGAGVTVDNQVISIDPAKVPVLPDCGPNQVVIKGSSGTFACVSAAPDSQQLGGQPAASYALRTDTAPDSAKLGGLPPASYASATAGVANNAAALGGLAPTNFVHQDPATGRVQLAGDVPLNAFRTTVSKTICYGAFFVGKCLGTSVLATTSVEGVYCGATAATTGDFSATEPNTTVAASSYRAAAILCQAVSSCSPNAHMCSSQEITRSRTLGTGTADGWYSTGAVSSGTVPIDDCQNWTTNVSTDGGPSVNSSLASYGTCNLSKPILCCA